MKHRRFEFRRSLRPILYALVLFSAINVFLIYAPAGWSKTYNLDFPNWYNFYSEKFDLYYSYREELRPQTTNGANIAQFASEDAGIKVTLTTQEAALLPAAKDCIKSFKLPEQIQTLEYATIQKRGKELAVGENENHFVVCERRSEKWLVLIWEGTKADFYESSVASVTASEPSSFKPDDRQVEQISIDFANYSHEQLQDLYYFSETGNVQAIYTAPAITGLQAADAHIRKLAVGRGYKLQFTPINLPVAATEFIQTEAYQNWQKLVAAAKKEGLIIGLTSTYRPIEEQQTLFLSRLNANTAGASYTQLATGNYDASINKTLEITAPPGYSRHHSGYALDVRDLTPGEGSKQFRFTKVYEWLSKDNYANAKKYGFIPSYPKGVEAGPEPEAWEYLWIGF